MQSTKKFLRENFEMKGLGPTTLCLGINIMRDRQKGKVWISQEAYALRILERFGMGDAKPVTMPLDPRIDLKADCSEEVNVPY
ncbi:hypothetical protein PR048_026517 [Dryococelus australis]|uniref:Reverse transcriptase Ty1/copia-type domain-containing protein n=1 Tax=Dryococelus australis TaxID=614101 RepID=A0ABQ9GLK2_9NEOP|nr:hypothetical protein PR048_026517 [Dryococelus australis]